MRLLLPAVGVLLALGFGVAHASNHVQTLDNRRQRGGPHVQLVWGKSAAQLESQLRAQKRKLAHSEEARLQSQISSLSHNLVGEGSRPRKGELGPNVGENNDVRHKAARDEERGGSQRPEQQRKAAGGELGAAIERMRDSAKRAIRQAQRRSQAPHKSHVDDSPRLGENVKPSDMTLQDMVKAINKGADPYKVVERFTAEDASDLDRDSVRKRKAKALAKKEGKILTKEMSPKAKAKMDDYVYDDKPLTPVKTPIVPLKRRKSKKEAAADVLEDNFDPDTFEKEEEKHWKGLETEDSLDPDTKKFVFSPFVAEPELAPRFDPMYNYERAALTRSMKYTKNVELTNEQQVDEEDPFAKDREDSLKAAAEMNIVRQQFKDDMVNADREDRATKDKIQYQLELETARWLHKPLPSVVKTQSDKVLINTMTKKVLDKVNPIADKIIHGAMRYDTKNLDKLRATKRDIERRVTTMGKSSNSAALDLVREARIAAANFTAGAEALHNAKLEAQEIRGAALLRADKESKAIQNSLKTKMTKAATAEVQDANNILHDSGLAGIARVDGHGLLVPLDVTESTWDRNNPSRPAESTAEDDIAAARMAMTGGAGPGA